MTGDGIAEEVHAKRMEDFTVSELQNAIHLWAVSKGWWDRPRNTGELLMLVVTELSEAMEDYRENKMKTYTVVQHAQTEPRKPCGFPSELADAVIRILDMAQALNIDLAHEIALKMKYNETRAFRHGNKQA